MKNAGTISGAGEVRMDQSGSTIVGSGDWSGHSGNLNFRSGTHTISNEVQMIRSGNIELNNTTTVFNDGGYVETSGVLNGTASSAWDQVYNSTLKISDNLPRGLKISFAI